MTEHDDRELEQSLRRFQPGGPPAELRARVMDGASGAADARRKIWPFWSLMAASVVMVLVLRTMAAAAYEGAWRDVAGASTDERQEQIDQLARALGDTPSARAEAERLVTLHELEAAAEPKPPVR
jgi:hypothetical protein